MNRMEGMRFTLNRQNTRSFGNFLAGDATRPPAPVACADIVVLRSPPIPLPNLKHVTVPFEIESIVCILLFLNQNKNSQNSPKRIYPKYRLSIKVNCSITNVQCTDLVIQTCSRF